MNAQLVSIIPKAPKMPSDAIFLLTYCCGPEQTRAEALCEEMGICDGDTKADELS